MLDAWLPEELMMNITPENNYSETAFTMKEGEKIFMAGKAALYSIDELFV